MEKEQKLQGKYAKRLSREEWLSRALEVLSREGRAKLRIDFLAKSLGVTKGSFYWHFKSRDDFIQSLAKYWAEYSTGRVTENVNQIEADPKKMLFSLMEIVFKEDLGRYDIAMRAWAAQEPIVARVVKEVDVQRQVVIRSLFGDLGFRGEELDIRARTFFSYMAGEHVFYARESKKELLDQLGAIHNFFTRP